MGFAAGLRRGRGELEEGSRWGERELAVDSGELRVRKEGRGLDCEGVARNLGRGGTLLGNPVWTLTGCLSGGCGVRARSDWLEGAPVDERPEGFWMGSCCGSFHHLTGTGAGISGGAYSICEVT